uniref:Negative elongation factor E n=1 Tax=Phallusia mammillata TaxID=59560 RepID=A0A6F9DR81_9ASCI|nr:negative elongation factor E-like [Phallusia mammillata]
MVFSSKLTEEEQFLKKQFQTLRDLKRELKQLTLKRKQEQTAVSENGPPNAKQKKAMIQANITPITRTPEFSSGGPNYNVKKITSVNAAANTEAAKKLLKSGAIEVKVEKKTCFKRSSNLKRKIVDSAPRRKAMFGSVGTDSNSTEDETADYKHEAEKSDHTSDEAQSKGNIKTTDDNKPLNKKFQRRDRRFEKKQAKRGNTVYVYGYVVSEKMVRENFTKFGNIVDIKIEQAKSSGFVTFDTFESADEAIKEMDDTLVDDCRLKVSLARRQPMLGSVVTSAVWSGLADRGDKGSAGQDSRSLVTYDDDDINFDT